MTRFSASHTLSETRALWIRWRRERLPAGSRLVAPSAAVDGGTESDVAPDRDPAIRGSSRSEPVTTPQRAAQTCTFEVF